MSARAFQNALARMIIDPDYRDRAREAGRPALPEDLTEKEARRLVRAARDPGMDVTRMLHKGFRLNKVLGRLPLTWTLLSDATLAAELGVFWQRRPPSGFSYLEEAIAFAEHLLGRIDEIDDPFLEEVVEMEIATLRLQLPAQVDGSRERETVHFRHDPAVLLGGLREGRRPSDAPALECVLVGTRAKAGAPIWTSASTAFTSAG